jgi:hypothetical protein
LFENAYLFRLINFLKIKEFIHLNKIGGSKMNLEIAKENLFKTKALTYFEALESKMELIKNRDKLDFEVEELKIVKLDESYYLKYSKEDMDNYKIAQAEKGM